MKRRLATLSLSAALLVLTVQPAFAGTFNMGL